MTTEINDDELPPLPVIDWTAKTVELSEDDLEALFDCGGTWPDGRVKIISDEVTGERRWSVDREIIFTVEGAPEGFALAGHYNEAATEMQDGEGWDSTFAVVRATPVVKIKYLRPEMADTVEAAQSDELLHGGDLFDMAAAADKVLNPPKKLASKVPTPAKD